MQKMKFQKLWYIICILFLMTQGIVFASGGSGSGSNPLTLESVEALHPIDAIATDDVILLNFSNNVVNIAVKENNESCFMMVDEAGNAVDFIAFFGDDQVDRDIRNTIEIKPNETWEPETTYILTISGDLMSKNGISFGEPLEVTFTVAPEGTYESVEGETVEVEATEVESVSEAVENGSINYVYFIIALVIIAGGYFIVKKNNK